MVNTLTRYMTKQEIYETIESLSHSQGFYGRVLKRIEEEPNILDFLAEQDFNDSVDLILFLEQ